MSNNDIKLKNLKFSVSGTAAGANLPLPGMIHRSMRSGSDAIDPLLQDLVAEKIYQLGSAARGDANLKPEHIKSAEQQLLAVEAEDGTTIFIRSDKLVEDIERIRPDAIVDGEIDFAEFKDPNAASRGLGEIFWKAATVLKLPVDGLLEEARELAGDWGKDLLVGQVTDKVFDVSSFLGAKAYMWKIESQLAGNSGLYHWQGTDMVAADRCQPNDASLTKAAKGEPMLLMIHGTGSYTQGSFNDLRQDQPTWEMLNQRFTGGIFGFEHRTFSQSPIENALELVEALPENARISLLTYSRGGLVGDLLCLGRNIEASVIDSYQINIAGGEADIDPEGLKQEEQQERLRLHDLLDKLAAKNIMVQRYIRVACPARGTRFLSDNLEVALSDFTNLLQTAGGTLVGIVAGAIGGPAAASTFGKGASSALGVVKRLVLEIAGRRIDPHLVPGIAAMCVDSPLASFLAHPEIRRHDQTKMAIIAGDTEFSSFGFSNFRRRIANLFCDWRLFDQYDNDLVVDTDSMYAGLGFKEGARYFFDQAGSVSHFRYFGNPLTRDALSNWLVKDDLAKLSEFLLLTDSSKIPWQQRDAKLSKRGEAAAPRPVAILIPGVMGTHIEINRKDVKKPGTGNRVWFDLFSLMFGGLDQIDNPKSRDVQTEDIFEMFYGDLAEFLQESHEVIRSPYDWRKSLDDCAKELLERIQEAFKKNADQPVRLLAHSMGGLVVRTLIKNHSEAWHQVIQSGGRLVMLGTPNNGSHSIVHSLLGKSDSMRKLAQIDQKHDLQEIVNVVRNFPGVLSLLPRPGFFDAGSDSSEIGTSEYYTKERWNELKTINKDRWFDDQIAGVPDTKLLNQTKKIWETTLKENEITNPERVSYVFGQSDKTPSGVELADNRIKLRFTSDGDGSVTWQSGRLNNLTDERYWYMPVEHADLTGEKQYFPAIVDLLEQGATGKLERLPRRRGEPAETFVLEAPPPVVANQEELMRAMMGSGPRKFRPMRQRKTLKVSVRTGDLCHCTSPVICGHYYGDVISGAEAAIDSMVDEQLSKRQQMGVYADEIGSSTIVLIPSNPEQLRRKTIMGTIIVGLGEMNGLLSSAQITETVRAGVLQYLLRIQEIPEQCSSGKTTLSSLLIGQNSTTHISITESITAVVQGICEANAKLSCDTTFISEIEFIEMYRDNAITAAHAIQDLPDRMAGELERLGMQLEPMRELQLGEGSCIRLVAESASSYWPRLIVTDADRNEEVCPAECYQLQKISPIPEEVLQELMTDRGYQKSSDVEQDHSQVNKDAVLSQYPEKLRYIFVSQRARSESTAVQRQPGLIEAIIKQQIDRNQYHQQLSRTLFELMVPLEYKPAAREVGRLVLQLDAYTANLPWELLEADNNEPMVIKTAVVRQLSTHKFRRNVRTAPDKTACIIVDPATDEFDVYFGNQDAKKLPRLEGAKKEGDLIETKLSNAGYIISYSRSVDNSLDILHELLCRPYRILAIAAHGVYQMRHKDGKLRSGVVLSGGALITAAEIGQMEVVPELVFLNCCHLGQVSTGAAFNRLAYSISRELIEMGVRCIVAAGWAVDDAAACTFAEQFFEEMLDNKHSFGDAVFGARKTTYRKHRSNNTWGAYQAYGDPGYRLVTEDNSPPPADDKFVAVDELLHELNSLRLRCKRSGSNKLNRNILDNEVSGLRQRISPEWLELPEVLEALGKLYANVNDGFEVARDYYLQAIAHEDKKGVVAIKTIEQLANMETRAGEKRDDEQGEELIKSAINRLKALHDVASSPQPSTIYNEERSSLLGSAYKRLASYYLKQSKSKQDWNKVKKALEDCAKAYQEASMPDPAAKPNATLNYLQFGFLAGIITDKELDQVIKLAYRCADTARREFSKDGDFWKGVMPADAEITVWLLNSKAEQGASDDAKKRREEIKKAPFSYFLQWYEDCINGVPVAERQMDSVATNLCILAKFLSLRNQSDDAYYAEVLAKLANHLYPELNEECIVQPETLKKPGSKARVTKK